VIDAINATGYGLTFGLQTRIDDRVQHVTERVRAGNIYVNRNQIGAIVGSQPFGGEGLSGTGPKAGGPTYLTRFSAAQPGKAGASWQGEMNAGPLETAIAKPMAAPRARLEDLVLPGPTGESNRLGSYARDAVLCLGPGAEAAAAQAEAVRALGGIAVEASGDVPAETLTDLKGYFRRDLVGRGEPRAQDRAGAEPTRGADPAAHHRAAGCGPCHA
jgi:RHH-type proline utilization regulon transcriptional repressor/proline dehydrogenase/delta 1-pyrroline-5-carboxylate dehydrogenase